MSVDISSWIWKHSPTKGSKRLLLLSLADNANDQGYCWPSIATIAKRCKMSKRYTQRLLKELEKEGHIIIIHRYDDKRDLNKSNMYQVVTVQRPLPLNGSEQETATPDDSQIARSGEQGTTRVVNRGSPKSSVNHQKEPSKRTVSNGDSIPEGFDIPEFITTWEDFKEHRKQIKKKMSGVAISRMLKKLGKYPVKVAIQMLETSIENGWQGVFEPKGYMKNQRSNNGFWSNPNKQEDLMGKKPGESDTEYQERRHQEIKDAPPV